MAREMADRRKAAVALLVAAALVAVGGISSYAAKYAHQESGEDVTASKAFYFTSDLLTSDGNADDPYELPVGTTSITFELRNYADDLRSTTEAGISYTYEVTKDGEGIKSSGSGTIEAGDQKKSEVNLDGLSAGTYTVTATSTSPYAQTLSATFVIAEADEAVYTTVTDAPNTATATLTIYTNDYKGDVSVVWPADVIPDEAYEGYAELATGVVSMEKFSSRTFRFFKSDITKSYIPADFTVAAK